MRDLTSSDYLQTEWEEESIRVTADTLTLPSATFQFPLVVSDLSVLTWWWAYVVNDIAALHWSCVFHACLFLLSVWQSFTLQATKSLSVYPLLPSQVVSICDLRWLVLYWFYMPGLLLDNKVSQSRDQLRATVYHKDYGHRTCRRVSSSRHWRRTCSRSPGAIETSSWFWRWI